MSLRFDLSRSAGGDPVPNGRDVDIAQVHGWTNLIGTWHPHATTGQVVRNLLVEVALHRIAGHDEDPAARLLPRFPDQRVVRLVGRQWKSGVRGNASFVCIVADD